MHPNPMLPSEYRCTPVQRSRNWTDLLAYRLIHTVSWHPQLPYSYSIPCWHGAHCSSAHKRHESAHSFLGPSSQKASWLARLRSWCVCADTLKCLETVSMDLWTLHLFCPKKWIDTEMCCFASVGLDCSANVLFIVYIW